MELDQMLAASTARKLAIGFVTDLRRDYKLPAYMFNRGDEERKKEEQRIADQYQQRQEAYRRMGLTADQIPEKVFKKRLAHVQNQYVVLIGGYPDQETARRSLDAIHKLKRPADEYCGIVLAGWQPEEGKPVRA